MKLPSIYSGLLFLLSTGIISCGPGQKSEAISKNDEEILVTWYSIPNEGLLSIEKPNAETLSFTLVIESGERCTGETFGTAVRQSDGSYLFGDKDCAIVFKEAGGEIVLEESGDLCDHGVHCSFSGKYSKVASEKFATTKADLASWMRMSISNFSCLLEKQYGYKSEKYPCRDGNTQVSEPVKRSWNEGPEFPTEKVKAIHPLIKDVSVQFQHGELAILTVTLEKKMVFQDVQRMFSLPAPFSNYDNDSYPNIMSVTFDDYDVDDKLPFSMSPVFVESFTLTAFDHTATGEKDASSPLLIEAESYYTYREDGESYVLEYEDGPGPYEFTCGSLSAIKTSSTLSTQGTSSYEAKNMKDMNESTAWVEGNDGNGEGEWIEFTLSTADIISDRIFSGAFVIQTGYTKSPSHWKKNSRPIKLKCYLNGQFVSIIQLQDTPDFQKFNIFPGEDSWVNMKENDVVRFEIIEVLPGTDYQDACISTFLIEGSCT